MKKKTFDVRDEASAVVIGAVIGTIVMLGLGLVIVYGILNGVSRSSWTAAQNTTFTGVVTAVGTTYSIGNLLPLVMIAATMMSFLAGIDLNR